MDSDVKKVIVSDYSDGFSIDVFFSNGRKQETFNFNQEDTRLAMKNVFKMLGVKDVRYQEVC